MGSIYQRSLWLFWEMSCEVYMGDGDSVDKESLLHLETLCIKVGDILRQLKDDEIKHELIVNIN